MFRLTRHRDHVGPGPIGQGTRTGTVDMGTMDGPKLPPTAVQNGGSVETPNTQTVLNQGGAWPMNPAIASLPNLQQGAREFVFDTRMEMQAQPPPGRILRQLSTRVFGYTHAGATPVGGNGFPFNGDLAFIPHQTVPRKPYGPSPYVRQWDNNAPISALYVANPRGMQ